MEFRLLQWNVLYSENIDAIVGILKEVDADILCLQEIIKETGERERDNAASIAAALRKHVVYQPAHHWKTPESTIWIGNAILSDFPIVGSSWSHLREPDLNTTDPAHEGRNYLEARIDVHGSMLTVATTHLSVKKFFEEDTVSRTEDERLLWLIEHAPRPYVLTGDLNHLPQSALIKRLRKILDHCGPDFTVPTWPTQERIYPEMQAHVPTWRLDYVFSQDVTATQATVLDVSASDHRPILVECTFDRRRVH